MLLVEFLLASVLALTCTLLLVLVRGAIVPRVGILGVFFVLLFGTWALAVRLHPIGPPIRGVYWASFVISAAAIALTIAVAG